LTATKCPSLSDGISSLMDSDRDSDESGVSESGVGERATARCGQSDNSQKTKGRDGMAETEKEKAAL
jgi:hypothetical protein